MDRIEIPQDQVVSLDSVTPAVKSNWYFWRSTKCPPTWITFHYGSCVGTCRRSLQIRAIPMREICASLVSTLTKFQ